MPPRSSVDRDENSLRDCSWTSYETKANKMDGSASNTNNDGNGNNPLDVDSAPVRVVKVTFAPTAKVRQVVKLTKDQAKDVWFTNEDFHKMKKSFAPTVQRMVAGDLSREEEAVSEEFCTRGLEYRTKDGARRRMKNKFDGMAAVLHEQDRQLFEDVRDPEALAKAYIEINCHCVFEALALGRRDEQDVKDYLNSNEDGGEHSTRSEADADKDIKPTAAGTAGAAGGAKRFQKQKLRTSSSFHERSLRSVGKGLKRAFSGSKLFHRRNQQVSSVAVA